MLTNPPRQFRSLDTLDRIVEATADLLRERAFEEVTVRDIIRRAGCPTGSFYARFKSKDDLLPYLYERYDADLKGRLTEKFAAIAWNELDLRQLCDAGIGLMVDEYVERRWLLREVALFARRNPQAISDDALARRVAVHQAPVRLFLPRLAEVAHPHPERAIEVGVFIAAAAARDAILFSDAPHATITNLSFDGLKAVLVHSLFHFLVQPCPPPHACCSPPSAPPSSRQTNQGKRR